MSNIAVLGYAPLPLEPSQRSYSGNFRTWNTIQYLLEKGHRITAIGMRLSGSFPKDYPSEKIYNRDNLQYYSVDELRHFHDLDYIRNRLKSANPDCIIGINSFPACQAARVELSIPFWADLNGYVMTEAQSKAHLFKDNEWLHHFWTMEKPVLCHADKFSTATERQKYALVGELATMGRLSKETYSYEFIHTFPNCIDPALIPPPENFKKNSGGKFTVLWAGTLNTWADVNTLAEGIYLASREIPGMEVIVTGGAVKGHDEKTARVFQDEIRKYKLNDLVTFTGWLELNELHHYLYKADCGLSIDDFCWESFIGARYRITNMLGFGLPVICTRNTEISFCVEKHELGLTVQPHSAESLCNALVKMANNSDTWNTRRENIKKKAEELFHYRHVLQPLGDWVQNPEFSPDHKGFRFPPVSRNDLMEVPARELFNVLGKKIQRRTRKIISTGGKKPFPPPQ